MGLPSRWSACIVASAALAMTVVGTTPPAVPTAAAGPAPGRQGPEVVLVSGPADRTADRTAAFTFTSDQPRVRYSARIDGGRWTRWSARDQVRFRGLAAGRHVAAFRARNAAGVVGDVVRTRFVVDRSVPSARFTGPTRSARRLPPTASVSFGTGDPSARYTCSVDGSAFESCESPYSLRDLHEGRHRLAVQATDAAGNSSDPVERTLLVAEEAPAAPAALLADDFESGDLGRWAVTIRGASTAQVQAGVAHSGTHAARFAATADPGSFAHARHRLAAPVKDLTVSAALMVEAEGASDSTNIPLLRLFDASGSRTVNIYRQTSSDQVWVQQSGTYTRTTAKLPLGTWRTLTARVAGTTLVVTVDGAEALSLSLPAALPAIQTIQIGGEVAAQPGTWYVDNVVATNSDTDATPPETSIDGDPVIMSGTEARLTFSATESGSFLCSLDGAPWYACASPLTLTALSKGAHTVAVAAVDEAGNVDPTPATASFSVAGTKVDALLIADNQNRRILVTDYQGNVLWKWDNPTGETSAYSGPLGLRALPNGNILATFGTGKVGELDPATKKFVYLTAGYASDWFKSPYDATYMPDGNLAVTTRQNEGGRVAVYDRTTGQLVWKYLFRGAHVAEMVPAGRGTDTTRPTFLVGGSSPLVEVVYHPGGAGDKQVVWRWSPSSNNAHRVILDRDQRTTIVSNWDNLVKLNRPGTTAAWSRYQGNPNGIGEVRGLALPTTGGYAFAYRIWYGASQIRFTDADGIVTRSFSALSDGTRLNLPWDLRAISWYR